MSKRESGKESEFEFKSVGKLSTSFKPKINCSDFNYKNILLL